jgi:anti-anti-sigma factor
MDEEGQKRPGLEGAEASIDQWPDDGGAVVIRVTGEVDMSNAANIQDVVDEVAASGVEKLVFDLGRLDFIDSSGLAVLLAAAQKVPSVHLRNPSSIVRRVVEITGLTEILPIEA